MNKVFFTISVLMLFLQLSAQQTFDLQQSHYYSISDSATFYSSDKMPVKIGGISGICKSDSTGEYLLIVDKASPVPGYFKVNININNQLNIRFNDFIKFKNPTIEGESIRIDPKSKDIYITNEKDMSTEVIKINSSGNEVPLAWYTDYANPMQFNSGYEGLCFSHDGAIQFTAIERPLPLPENVYNNYKIAPVVPIIKEDRATEYKTIYGYPLKGKEKGTGVSEIIYRDKNLLWVIERSYIKAENRNVVSIYSINLANTLFLGNIPIEFHDITELLRPYSILDFNLGLTLGETLAKPGNIEGACFSHDGKYLILITDNNYGNKDHTPTQIYALRIAD